jgi:hypothetical protein
VISAVVDERLSTLSVTTDTVRLYDQTIGQYVAGEPALSPDGQTISFSPLSGLVAGHYYQALVGTSNLTDLAGNTLTSTGSFICGGASSDDQPPVEEGRSLTARPGLRSMR